MTDKTPKGRHEMSNHQDMKAAQSTYENFISTLKWAVPLVAILTFIIILIIS